MLGSVVAPFNSTLWARLMNMGHLQRYVVLAPWILFTSSPAPVGNPMVTVQKGHYALQRLTGRIWLAAKPSTQFLSPA